MNTNASVDKMPAAMTFFLGMVVCFLTIGILIECYPVTFSEPGAAYICREIGWQSPTCAELKQKRLNR